MGGNGGGVNFGGEFGGLVRVKSFFQKTLEVRRGVVFWRGWGGRGEGRAGGGVRFWKERAQVGEPVGRGCSGVAFCGMVGWDGGRGCGGGDLPAGEWCARRRDLVLVSSGMTSRQRPGTGPFGGTHARRPGFPRGEAGPAGVGFGAFSGASLQGSGARERAAGSWGQGR